MLGEINPKNTLSMLGSTGQTKFISTLLSISEVKSLQVFQAINDHRLYYLL